MSPLQSLAIRIALVTTIATAGAAILSAQEAKGIRPAAQAETVNKPADIGPKTDAEGELLPRGVLARLGSSMRWRHGGAIVASALSPDRKRLATASARSIVIWDLPRGKILNRFPVPANVNAAIYTEDIRFSPDGQKLGYRLNGSSGICYLENAGKLRKFKESECFSQFTPDGKEVVLFDESKLRFCDTATGQERHVVDLFRWARLSPDGRVYLRIDPSDTPALSLRRVETGTTIMQLHTNNSGKALQADFAPDSKTFAVVDVAKKEIQVVDVAKGKQRCTLALPKPAVDLMTDADDGLYAWRVGFSEDSTCLALARVDGVVHRWDLATKKELPALIGHCVGPVHLHDIPRSKVIVTTGADGSIRHWDRTTGKETVEIGGYTITCAALAPNGRVLAIADARGRVGLWDPHTHKAVRVLRSNGPPVGSVALSADSNMVAIGRSGPTITIHDLTADREVKVLRDKNLPKAKKDTKTPTVFGAGVMLGPDLGPISMAFSADGRFLLATDDDIGGSRIWDLATGAVCWRSDDCVVAAFAPDGKTLAVADATKGKVSILDSLSKQARCTVEVQALLDKDDDVRTSGFSLAYSPDGRWLAVMLDEHTVVLDARTLAEVAKIPVAGAGNDPAFSRNGHWLTLVDGELLRVWEVATGKEVMRVQGHIGPVVGGDFVAGDRTLVSLGGDDQVYLWTLRPEPAGKGEPSLDTLWQDLGSADASAAYRAIWALSERAGMVEYLASRITPAKSAATKIRKLVLDLDSSEFTVRQEATTALKRIGHQATRALAGALERSPSLEAQRRMEDILKALRRPLEGEPLRHVRAVQALHLAGTPAARRLLGRLAGGADGDPLTAAARAAGANR